MTKKRKRDVVEQLKGSIEHVKLKVYIPDALPCEICGKSVYNYRLMNEVTCSYSCYSILYISKIQRMLHEDDNKNFDKMNEDI